MLVRTVVYSSHHSSRTFVVRDSSFLSFLFCHNSSSSLTLTPRKIAGIGFSLPIRMRVFEQLTDKCQRCSTSATFSTKGVFRRRG